MKPSRWSTVQPGCREGSKQIERVVLPTGTTFCRKPAERQHSGASLAGKRLETIASPVGSPHAFTGCVIAASSELLGVPGANATAAGGGTAPVDGMAKAAATAGPGFLSFLSICLACEGDAGWPTTPKAPAKSAETHTVDDLAVPTALPVLPAPTVAASLRWGLGSWKVAADPSVAQNQSLAPVVILPAMQTASASIPNVSADRSPGVPHLNNAVDQLVLKTSLPVDNSSTAATPQGPQPQASLAELAFGVRLVARDAPLPIAMPALSSPPATLQPPQGTAEEVQKSASVNTRPLVLPPQAMDPPPNPVVPEVPQGMPDAVQPVTVDRAAPPPLLPSRYGERAASQPSAPPPANDGVEATSGDRDLHARPTANSTPLTADPATTETSSISADSPVARSVDRVSERRNTPNTCGASIMEGANDASPGNHDVNAKTIPAVVDAVYASTDLPTRCDPQPAVSQAPPAQKTSAPEPPPEPATQTGPRDVSLHLADGDSSVDIRMAEHAGEIRVTVHTQNHDLATSLRTDLPDLVGKLRQGGFQADIWRPSGATQSETGRRNNGDTSAFQDHPPGGRREGRQKQPQPDSKVRSQWTGEWQSRLDSAQEHDK